MSKTVAEVLVEVLEEIGVQQIFGLIGDSLNPLGDAVRKFVFESGPVSRQRWLTAERRYRRS